MGDLSNLFADFGGVTSVCLLSWPELCRLTADVHDPWYIADKHREQYQSQDRPLENSA